MEPDHTLAVDFLRPVDFQLLSSLPLFAEEVVRRGLWAHSRGSLFNIATEKFIADTIVVTFLRWPGTPLVLEIRESGFHQTRLGQLLAGQGRRPQERFGSVNN
jgi:hypothetical protein